MTTTNDWIRMSERRPTMDDMPVWFWRDEWERNATPLLTNILSEALKHDRWLKTDIPAPPKEQTQRERDEAAYRNWWDSSAPIPVNDVYTWHAALAWERAEIAKLMDCDARDERTAWFFSADKIADIQSRLRP